MFLFSKNGTKISVNPYLSKLFVQAKDYKFKLSCRGEQQVQGKGIIKTYWLEGYEGYDKPLPVGAPDHGKSHGLKLKDYMTDAEIEAQMDAVQRCIDNMTLEGEKMMRDQEEAENQALLDSLEKKDEVPKMTKNIKDRARLKAKKARKR